MKSTEPRPVGPGLPPLCGEKARVLILGSFPSPKSREQGFYYGHPQNRFWPLMARLLENQEAAPQLYGERLAMLLRHHIALWDSIDTCDREGSLDTAIHNVRANDFTSFLKEYPRIHTICFNGAKSAQTFKRYNKDLLSRTDLHFFAMPSTSPANARWRMDMLLEEWKKAFS